MLKNISTFIEEDTTVLAGFCGGKKTRETGEKPSEQGENQQQTQPTYGTEPESNLGHIEPSRHYVILAFPVLRSQSPFCTYNHQYKGCEIFGSQNLSLRNKRFRTSRMKSDSRGRIALAPFFARPGYEKALSRGPISFGSYGNAYCTGYQNLENSIFWQIQ